MSLLGRQARFFLTLATLAVLACFARPAHAWIETTVLTDDVRVEVDRAGMGVVEHTMQMRIRGGPLRALTLPGVDADAAPEGEPTASLLTKEGGQTESTVPLTVTMQPDAGLRIEINDGKGLGKGTYLIKLRYRTNLLGQGALERDGAAIRLRWLGPKLPNGLDAAKTVFVLPAAPTEPRAAGERRDGDLALPPDALAVSGAGAFLTTSRRFPERDELEMMRPHVARGEQVAWTLRIDPRALGAINDPRIKPPPSVGVQTFVRESARERQVFLAVGAGLAVLVTALAAIKLRQVAAHAKAAGAEPRGVVPLPLNVRALLAGPTFAGGVALQLFAYPPALGSVLVAAGMALLAHRGPRPMPVARAPGRWLPLADEEAFAAPPSARDTWLDASTWSGKLGLAIAALVLTGVVFLVHGASPYHAPIAALDGLALLTIFMTGRVGELPRSLALAPQGDLKKLAKKLRKDASLRVVPWARFPNGSASPDELRLLVMPKTPMRGLSSIEIGYAYAGGAGGPIACPQILVRVAEESTAEQRARSAAPFGKWVRGRRAGELVLTVEPRFPSRALVASLAHELATLLAEPGSRKAKAPSATQPAAVPAPRRAPEQAESFPVTDGAWGAIGN